MVCDRSRCAGARGNRAADQQSLRPCLARRRCGQACRHTANASEHLYIGENPFNDIATTVRGNPERKRFIGRDIIDRVMEAAPDTQWRLIIALAKTVSQSEGITRN